MMIPQRNARLKSTKPRLRSRLEKYERLASTNKADGKTNSHLGLGFFIDLRMPYR